MMAESNNRRGRVNGGLKKSPTGINGLDDILGGGLPEGRPTLICGSAGCGKTLMAMEFLVRGVLRYKEPGVFVAFEETPDELRQNVASLGFDLAELCARKKLSVDYVHIERSEIQETGEYDLEGLFIRLQHAIESVGAKRVVLDTMEGLFGALPNESILRAEIRRLFRWLKDRGLTAVITAERGTGQLTRHGLEEYVSDCVILLDHRVTEQISTRRLRIVKYRGTTHGTNEYPFLVDEHGISVLPVTSLNLHHAASTQRVSTGVPALDDMLGGKGFFRGSTVLVSGAAGTGKTSLAAHFAEATCRRGEPCIFFAFEESRKQIIRNMRSIGIDLEPWARRGLLQFQAARPTVHGIEMHLVTMHKLIEARKPRVVIADPITNLVSVGSSSEVQSMLTRLIDFLKLNQITAMFTSLTTGGSSLEQSEVGISSLIDTWLLLRELEANGERNRGLYVLKSRGMAHSNQIREFLLTGQGVRLVDAYLGPGGVLTGSARLAQESQDRSAALEQRQEMEGKQVDLERKRKLMEAQVAALRAEYQAQQAEFNRAIAQEKLRNERLTRDRIEMAQNRYVDGVNRGERTAGKRLGNGTRKAAASAAKLPGSLSRSLAPSPAQAPRSRISR